MRKIVSKHSQDKKRKLNQFLVGGVLVFIMLFSIVGYSFQRRGDEGIKKIKYNGAEFVKKNNLWFLNSENFEFAFKHNPNEVERSDSELNYFEHYFGKPLYIYSEDKDAELEIYRNLDQIALRIRRAYLQGEEGDENLAVKNCESNFIIIKENSTNGIVQDENCVFIQASKENLVKITDEFLFKILKIRG